MGSEEDKEVSNIINNSNGSIKSQEKKYEYHERLPKSIPKKNNKIIKNELINRDVLLPNLYGNNKSGISNNSPPKINLNLR